MIRIKKTRDRSKDLVEHAATARVELNGFSSKNWKAKWGDEELPLI